ncbi:MAG: NADH-quinone oxidoreductase subunit H [Planctomycetes bacterium]|nr:NADH-quinone oxidoreductase subunit H [Planctomycetota bacterium]
MGEVIGVFLVASFGSLAVGLVSSWVDRKVTARVQYRVGPPLLQPVYDIVKLLGKETLLPERARGRGFLWAPPAGFAAAAVAAAALWYANVYRAGFVGDLIVVIYLLTIPAIAAIYGAMASGSPHATIGASREMKMLLAYELPLVMAVLVPVVKVSQAPDFGPTFAIGSIVAFQQAHGWALASVSGAIAAVVALVCLQAKLTLVPFDLPEAETELMGGSHLEYSGPPLAMLKLTRMLLLAVGPILLATLFLGGLADAASGWSWLALAGKFVAILVLVVLIRNTNPRLRIDQTVRFFWFGLAPLAAAALVLAWFGY